jgi:hypothetical protein
MEMDPVFTAALRDVLKAAVRDSPRVRRRWRWRMGTGVLFGLTIVAGGVAVASGLFSLPGAPVDSLLGNSISAMRTGTATIDIGAPPTSATDVSLALTCLTAGTFTFPNGSSMTCGAADLLRPTIYRTASEVVPLTADLDSVTITTSPNATWSLLATYVNQVTTTWGVNASGETYGVSNQQGTPDLIAVVIDQSKIQGYVQRRELSCASGGDVKSPAEALTWDETSQNRNISIPVYESDGVTIVGTFSVGSATGPNSKTVPLSLLSLGC